MNEVPNKTQVLNNDLEYLLKIATTRTLRVTETVKTIKASYKVKVVYIAGKVTGLEPTAVAAKFNKRKKELIDAGYIVINPCDYISSDTDWGLAMAICFVLLPHANYISLLHDWQDSKGAIMEKEFADKMGIELLDFKPCTL